MAKKVSLTEARVRDLRPPATGREEIWDAKQAGLCVRVTASGAKSYCVVRKVAGRKARATLGKHPAMTVIQARKLAAEGLATLARGGDIRANRRRQKEASATVADIFEAWLAVLEGKRSPATTREYRRLFRIHCRSIAKRRAAEITRADVARLHGRLGADAPYQANRMASVLRACWNWGRKHGLLAGENPATGIERFREESRDRFLRPEEIQTFFRSVLAEPDDRLRDFFLLCLFTGARRLNVLSMAWADVDLQQATWRIPKAKGGKPVVLPLVEPAVQILLRRDETRGDSVYVLPGHGKTRHLAEPKMAWKRLCNRGGFTDLRMHDLRRTLASWQAIGGASMAIIGASLGHKAGSTATSVYARLTTDAIRASTTAATDKLLLAAGPVAQLLAAGPVAQLLAADGRAVRDDG